MKTLWNVLVLTLALNFLLVAGVVGWLWQSKRLDKPRAAAIREVLFPTTMPATAPSTQPVEEDAKPPEPLLKLEDLLAKQAGRPAVEQLDFIKKAFEAQMAQLDRRRVEITNLQSQVGLAQERLRQDRQKLESEKQALAMREREAQALAADQGFQDSLTMYSTMPAKQVKQIFMSLEEPVVTRYLRAMEPTVSKKIVREFKTPAEVDRIQRLLERMRLSPPPATQPSADIAQPAVSG